MAYICYYVNRTVGFLGKYPETPRNNKTAGLAAVLAQPKPNDFNRLNWLPKMVPYYALGYESFDT